MLTPLTFESLQDFKGGIVGIMVNKALGKMAQDLESAPDINSWREVDIKIRAKPKMENMELDSAVVEIHVSGKVPTRSTSAIMTVRSAPGGAKQLQFELDASDNPDQMSLLDGQ